jgi:TonB family protein
MPGELLRLAFAFGWALRIARNIPSRGVPRLLRVFLLFAFLFSFSSAINGQPAPDAANSPEQTQSRIERARALIAAHRLDTAASELESVRAATHDYAVRNITSIMLMSVYLEEGNYGRAEALLEENYQDHHQSAAAAPGNPARSAQKDESFGTYFALAGQAVNGARTHLARYRSFGINTSGTSLPAEAISDLNRLRSLLERMIAQAKEISNGRRAYDSLSLLEDVLGIRLSLAKDSEDQAKWETEYASAREALASSQTQIASLGGIPPLRPAKSPVNKGASSSPYSTKKISDTPLEIKASQKDDSAAQQPSTEAVSSPQSIVGQSPGVDDAEVQPPGDAKADEPPISDAGSLNAKATKMVQPRYPPSARRKGAAGLVRVHVIVDETGKVIAVSHTEGPMLLRAAAEEAARQWSFGGISPAGGPARFSGYIDFNFTL